MSAIIAQAKAAYAAMKLTDPAQAAEAFELLRGPKLPDGTRGERNLKGFVTLISGWQRSRQLSLDTGNREMDEKDFYGYWRGRNRDDPSIARKWARATKPEMFQRKLAWHNKKGKAIVWQRLQREINNKDMVIASLGGENEKMHCSKAAAQEMMTRDSGLSLHHSAKGMFGGLASLVDGDHSDDSSEEEQVKGKQDDQLEVATRNKKAKKVLSSSSGSQDSSDSDDKSKPGAEYTTL